MNKNYYAILMAGGVGSRFWPVSTTEFPKQFHDMLGTGETLIQKTFSRLSKLIPIENILILTNEKYNDLVLEQLPQVSQSQVLLEPAMRIQHLASYTPHLKFKSKIQTLLWWLRQAIIGSKMKWHLLMTCSSRLIFVLRTTP